MTGLRPQLESKFSDVQGTKLENNLQNYSGASRASSSQYAIVAAKGFSLKSRISSTHPPSGPAGYHRLRKRKSDRYAQALLLTGAPGCPTFFFCGRRPLPFGGSHLRLPSGPAGIRTTTGSLSALARPTPYQLSHRVAYPGLSNRECHSVVPV